MASEREQDGFDAREDRIDRLALAEVHEPGPEARIVRSRGQVRAIGPVEAGGVGRDAGSDHPRAQRAQRERLEDSLAHVPTSAKHEHPETPFRQSDSLTASMT